MSEDVRRRMLSAREKWVTVGGREYKVRRPLGVEVHAILKGADEIGLRLALDFVVDWRGFTEADLLPDGVGGSDAVPFTPGAYREWIGDRLGVLRELADLIWTDYLAHQERLKAVPGK